MALSFQHMVETLNNYWAKQGCAILHPYDTEKGASTMNPATFLRVLGPEPWALANIEPCRRPTDGRYGQNPNRLQHYFQYQVILKPSPDNIQDLYLRSLEALGIDLAAHDVRFVEDNWESPTLGAWGTGWEVWLDGMEITQFTYFQQAGGLELKPVSVELTYGIERIATYLQGVESVYDIRWNDQLTYGDIYLQNEIQQSTYNFEASNAERLTAVFDQFYAEAEACLAATYGDANAESAQNILVLPAFDYVLKCSHTFNLLDARGVISKDMRTQYILRIRKLAEQVARAYVAQREALGYPLLKQQNCMV